MQPKLLRRFFPALLMLMMFISASTLAHAVQVTSTWTGAGDGTTYTDAANWSTPEFPRNGTPAGTTYKAVIDNSANAANVQLNIGVSLDALVINSGDRLSINDGVRLTLVNTGAGTGTIVNAGTLALNSTGASVQIFTQGDVTLSGGGTITMTDQQSGGLLVNVIAGSAVTDRFTNVDNTIRGTGVIGNGQIQLTNRGTIVAQGTNPLVLNPAGTTNVNTGTLRGDGGTLVVFNSNLTNSNGTLEARAGSSVDLSASTITGGTLTTVGTGLVRSGGFQTQTSATLNGVTNLGNFKVIGSTSAKLVGTMTNRGDIRLASSEGGGFANLAISEQVVLNGGGTITMDDATSGGSLLSNIAGVNNQGGERLTNEDNTIRGAGSIGGIAFINNGTIIPIGENPLFFSNAFTNAGTIRIDAAGKMVLGNSVAMTQTGGLTLVNGSLRDVSTIFLGAIAINGGTLAGTGTIDSRVTNTGGTISPGNITGTNDSSIGTLSLGKSYSQQGDGKMFIQINGPTAGSEFDRLAVGSALFDGALNVKLGGSYAPARDTGFTIVTYSSGNGRMTLNVLDQDNRGGFTQQYNPADLTLVAQGIPTIGVNIQPTQVFTNTVLTATVVTAPETPVNSVTYDFQVNGVSKQNSTSNTFDLGVAGQGDKNDVITVVAQTDDDRRNQNSLTVQNSKPVAQSSTDNKAKGGELISIPLTGTDLDSDALTFRIVAGARNGVAALRAVDGGFVLDYTGRATFSGTEKIQFVASDGTATSEQPATIEIKVTGQAPNRPPVIPNNAFGTVAGGQTVDVPIVASDPDGDPITFKSVGGPKNGTGEFLVVDGKPVFRYNSSMRFNGLEIVRFIAQDGKPGGDSEIRTINIAVDSPTARNQAPVARNSSGEADAGVLTSFRLNVADDGPIVSIFSKSVGGPSNGTGFFQYDENINALVYRYTSRANFAGTETIRFVVNDEQGALSEIATLTITVSNPTPTRNRAPVALSNGGTQTNAGQSIDIPVTVNDPDAADTIGTLIFKTVRFPAKGTLQSVFLREGRVFFRYLPNAGANGADSFSFTASDRGGLTSNVATISLNINASASRNTAPVAFSSSSTVAIPNRFIDIPVNVTDREDTLDRLFFQSVRLPNQGTLDRVFLRDGNVFFRYRANSIATGTDSFTYNVRDSGGLISNVATISITFSSVGPPPNRAPVAFSSATARATAGQAVDIAVSVNDPDAQDTLNTLVFKTVQSPTKGTLQNVFLRDGNPFFRYLPNAGASGTDSFKFTVTDRGGLTSNVATIAIAITATQPNPGPPANRAPIINAPAPVLLNPETRTASVLFSAYDPDNDPIRFEIVESPRSGTGVFDSSGYYVYTDTLPLSVAFGENLRFVAVDSKGARSAVATLQIGRANNTSNTSPLAINSNPTVVVEGQTIRIPISAYDRNGDRLSFFLTQPNLPNGTGFIVEEDTPGGPVLVYTPRLGTTGGRSYVDQINFRADDGKPQVGPLSIGVARFTVLPVGSSASASLNSASKEEVKTPSGGSS